MKSLNEYQAEARRTATRPLNAYPYAVRVAAAALEIKGQYENAKDLLRLHDIHMLTHGLTGEAGEVADLIKKLHGHGKTYDETEVLHELGDCLWYLANLAFEHGFTLSEVAEANSKKLRKRYPKGFTVEDAKRDPR